MTPDGFIAKRILKLSEDPSRDVTVLIGRPKLDGDAYRCEFQIIGLKDGKTRSSHATGLDSMQALLLTLQAIGTELYTSDAAKRGRLSWEGSPNLGFPVPNVIADLVPKDSHLVGMLFDFRYDPGEWHRTIDCGDWANAREVAIDAATLRKAEWVEIHAHDGATETWRYSHGKWGRV